MASGQAAFVGDFVRKTHTHRLCNVPEYMSKLVARYESEYNEALNEEHRTLLVYNSAPETKRKPLEEAKNKAKKAREELEASREGEILRFQTTYTLNGKPSPRYVIVSIPNCNVNDVEKAKPEAWLKELGVLAFHFFREGERYTHKPQAEPLAHVVFVLDSLSQCIYPAAPAFLTTDKNGATVDAKNAHYQHWVIVSSATAQKAVAKYASINTKAKTFVDKMTAPIKASSWAHTITAPTSEINAIKESVAMSSLQDANSDEECVVEDDDANTNSSEDVVYSPLNSTFETQGKITHEVPRASKSEYASPASPSSKPPAQKRQRAQQSSASTSKSSSSSSPSALMRELLELFEEDESRLSASANRLMHAHINENIQAISDSYTQHITDGRDKDPKMFASDPKHSMAVFHRSCQAEQDVPLPPQTWAALGYFRRTEDETLRNEIESAGALFQKAKMDWAKGALTATRADVVCAAQSSYHRVVILASADGISVADSAISAVLKPRVKAVVEEYSVLERRLEQQEGRVRDLEDEMGFKDARIAELEEREQVLQADHSKLKKDQTTKLRDLEQRLAQFELENAELMARVEELSKAAEPPGGDSDF